MIKLKEIASFLGISKSRAHQILKFPAKKRTKATQHMLDSLIPLFLAEQELKFEAETMLLMKTLTSKKKK